MPDQFHWLQGCFWLYTQTFPMADSTHLWNPFPSKIIQNSYYDTTYIVKTEGSFSSWFRIITGERQSDIWSPLLFGVSCWLCHGNSCWQGQTKEDWSYRPLVPRRGSKYPEVKLVDLVLKIPMLKWQRQLRPIVKLQGNLVSRWATKRQISCPLGKLVPPIP